MVQPLCDDVPRKKTGGHSHGTGRGNQIQGIPGAFRYRGRLQSGAVRLRFAEGFVCPKCGGREFYPIKGRNTYQCRCCRHQTSVTAGTVMHHSRLPLTVWFWAIWLVATDKRGISAV